MTLYVPPPETELPSCVDRCPSGGTFTCSGLTPGHRSERHGGHRCLCAEWSSLHTEVSWCSSAASHVDAGPTDHSWTVPGETQALGKAALQCVESLHHQECASSLQPVLLCSSCLTWPLRTVLSHQISSLLCPCIYLPSVVGHVTEGFNLFTALLSVIYPLYSLPPCII